METWQDLDHQLHQFVSPNGLTKLKVLFSKSWGGGGGGGGWLNHPS